MQKITVYADGGARGNPGPAAIGVVVIDGQGNIIERVSRYIGRSTNNQAEYAALIAGLEAAIKLRAEETYIYLDSELLVKQLQGRYAVKSPHLMPLFQRARSLLDRLPRATISHVPREANKLADALVNQALNSHQRSSTS